MDAKEFLIKCGIRPDRHSVLNTSHAFDICVDMMNRYAFHAMNIIKEDWIREIRKDRDSDAEGLSIEYQKGYFDAASTAITIMTYDEEE